MFCRSVSKDIPRRANRSHIRCVVVTVIGRTCRRERHVRRAGTEREVDACNCAEAIAVRSRPGDAARKRPSRHGVALCPYPPSTSRGGNSEAGRSGCG